ncbi:MAG: GNAT family N-acetyltransferase [Burkholderiaceae bacterium]
MTVNEANAVPTSGWVPIRSISSSHREQVASHLLELGPEDRFLRFGFQATDSQIAQYVDGLDFERDEIFGIFNRRLELIALAHLANASATGSEAGGKESEFGVSVLAQYRGRGFGRRLFARAALHARNHGVDTLLIHALSQNRAMLGIVREAGAVVQLDGSETTSRLSLPSQTWASQVDEMAESQAAEIDYRFKQQALHLNGLVKGIAEVKKQIANVRIASE